MEDKKPVKSSPDSGAFAAPPAFAPAAAAVGFKAIDAGPPKFGGGGGGAAGAGGGGGGALLI